MSPKLVVAAVTIGQILAIGGVVALVMALVRKGSDR